MTDRTKSTWFVLLCVLLWALIPVVAKLGQTRLDNHQFLFYSSLCSFIVVSIIGFYQQSRYELKQLSIANWAYLILLGFLGTYLYYLLLYLGYARAVGMEVLVFQYTWPLFIVLLSVIFYKERLTIWRILAVILGVSGVTVVITKGNWQSIDLSDPTAIGFVILGAFSFAVFSVLSKNSKIHLLTAVLVYFLTAMIVSFISMLFLSSITIPHASEWWPILLNGILVNGISYLFWLKALRLASAAYLAPFTFITPALSACFLLIWFDEPFSLAYGLGLLGIISGGIINSLSKEKLSKK